MPVIPLHLHSHWSLLDGVPSVAEIVAFARSLDLPALALTDTNALYGAPEFASTCHEAGLRSIFGATLSFDGGHSLGLLAQNAKGYANLCALITRLQAAPNREASLERGLTLHDLAAHADGLIALSGGHDGPIDLALRDGNPAQAENIAHKLRDVFGADNFFVELQLLDARDAAKAIALQRLAAQIAVQTVATHDIRYLSPADAARYRVLSAMRQGKLLKDLPPLPDLSFPSLDEMQRRFHDFPSALGNTQRVADRCQFELPLGQWHFPSIDLPPGRTQREELWALARTGAAHRYGDLTPELEARLRREVDVIDALGYMPYFVAVADIVRFAREQRVPVSPRGSASSSVVAYCLGIHDIDPLAHNLYFERFLSLERHDPPDIDLDLCSRRRDEVIEYVYRKYGADKVAMVCTYATLRPRLALREVGKVYGLPERRVKELSEQLPWFWSPAARAETNAVQAKLLQQARDSIEREVLEMSRTLDGTPHHLSVHPGGIVISPGPITDLVPLQYATKGMLITQFDLAGVGRLGLVKIDLLGISALTVIADCVELIQKHRPDFTLESIPLQDETATWALSTAQTIGCFQIESPGMRLTLREVQARSVEDVIVALALFRPGPLKGGLKDAFVRRHLGREEASYLHPALEPVLGESYGVVLYQEQVLRIAHEIAGFTLGEADLLRRAMSKKSEREMARLRRQFLDGAQAVSGMDVATAEQVWDLMAAFAGYGFPKAHAVGYASVAYRMVYLKSHFPAEFMAARLAVSGGYYSPRVYMSEARRLGLIVKPPHVNHSDEAFTLESPRTLWMGLDQVRDLTRATAESIIAHRPFVSLDDFLARAQPQHVEAMNLIKVGALEDLDDIGAMLATVEQAPWRGRHTAQISLMPESPHGATLGPSLQQHAAWEQDILGMHVGVHLVQLAAEKLSRYHLTSSDRLSACADREVVLIGVRLAAHRFNGSQEEPMLLVDMEDEAGIYQVLWSGPALRQGRPLLSARGPMLIRGRVRTDRQGVVVVAGYDIAHIEDVLAANE